MKRVIGYRLLVMGLVILLSFIVMGCTGSQQGKAEDANTWNFGQVKKGRVLKHNFVLKNESQTTLTIKDINTSCGCTVSRVKKKIILPQDSALIEVRFNSKDYSGRTQQYIYVHTDSLDNSVVRYIIKADVAK